MKKLLAGVSIAFSLVACNAGMSPCIKVSDLSRLTLCEPVKIDSLADDKAPNGDYSLTAILSFPDSLSALLENEAMRKGYRRLVEKGTEPMPVFMNSFYESEDKVRFFHSSEPNEAGDTYVLLNFSTRKVILYAVRI